MKMADIRENETLAQSPLARARASSSDRMSDINRAGSGAAIVEANIAANAAKKYGVKIFGRLHSQQWDDIERANECAERIGGVVVEVN
jgi:hypothetical protein